MFKPCIGRSNQVNAIITVLKQLQPQSISVTTWCQSGETPYLLWYSEKPNLKHVKVSGCVVYTHILDTGTLKVREEGTEIKELRFIGFTEQLVITKFGMKKSVNVMIIMMLSSEFGKSKNANELELEN